MLDLLECLLDVGLLAYIDRRYVGYGMALIVRIGLIVTYACCDELSLKIVAIPKS